ncbi:MAG TPA: hypothetical protein VGH33_25075 [Isosphaeraceae bacterium]
MEKVVHIARSFEEADRADREYYQSLTPLQRLEILFELNRRWPKDEHAQHPEGFARVCRIIKF